MISSNTIGVFLQNDGERDTIRAAILNCGLQPVNLARTADDSGWQQSSGQDEPHPGRESIPAATGLPRLIVTGTKIPVRETGLPALASASWDSNASLLILVLDPEPANSGSSVEIDPAYAWLLYRPLQLAAVTSQLRSAVRAIRAFSVQHHAMLEELHRSRRIFDSVSNGISVSDATAPDLPLIYVNPAFEQLTGYAAEDIYGQNCRFLHGKDTVQPGLTKVREAIRLKRDVRVVLKNYRKDGTSFWNELYLSPILDLEGRITHFVGIQNDVTEQVESSQRLEYLAHYDALTGLTNRCLLVALLQQAMLRAQRTGAHIAVLFFDLDNFKHVNDVFGHDAGDRLLQVVAERLRASARSGEVVARLGGDEFVVVLESLADERQLTSVMCRLVSRIQEPADICGQPFLPSTSVGMALFPRDGNTPEALMKAADLNMYAAKQTSHLCDQSRSSSVIPTNARARRADPQI